MSTLNNFIAPYVERAVSETQDDIAQKEAHGEKVNFTDSLSQFTKDRTVLRDQLVSTLLAGRDTTACTLSWLTYELAYHPEVYAKLREEVMAHLGMEGRPTYEDLKSMKYMQSCLNEGNPLFPDMANASFATVSHCTIQRPYRARRYFSAPWRRPRWS